jgi:hypothetical protein
MHMMTRKEAESAVRSELSARKLTKNESPAEMLSFCQEMYERLQFRSKSDRLSDIRAWPERWESTWLPSSCRRRSATAFATELRITGRDRVVSGTPRHPENIN